jgi:hypothetical protein
MSNVLVLSLRHATALCAGITAISTLVQAAPNVEVSATRLPKPIVSTWSSGVLGRDISKTVYLPDDSDAPAPAVVYLKNLPTPRIGGDPDEMLIAGFLDQGMIVIVADYENDPKAVAPDLLLDIDDWYGYLFATKPHGVDPAWIYILPAGYAIERNVHICDVRTHRVCMDVFYPSGSAERVPAALQITSSKPRGEWINQRAYYIYGLLTTGYAGAIMDWTAGGADVLFQEHVFPEKLAARLLRARAKDWSLSGALAVTGHSKGSGRAAAAALINELELETDLGPYPNQSSRFQVALLSAGQHDKEHLREDGFIKRPVEGTPEELRRVSTVRQITPDDPPLFLSVGAQDEPFRVRQMQRVAARCEEVGVEYRFVLQQGMGHMYNPRPEVIGHIYGFLDHYLKTQGENGNAPVDQKELDALANQMAVPLRSASGESSGQSYSGPDASALAALESLGAVVEVGGAGSDQFAVEVDLRSGRGTNAALQHVKRLTHLRELRLDGIQIADDGLKYLQGMSSLERLDLPGTGITDQGLGYLSKLKNLRALSIKGNRITDAGLTHLQELSQLEMLSLGPNQISSVGLESLQNMTKLTYLNLTDTQVTDSVVEYLKPLASLRTLRLRGTQVTEKGVQELKRTLPDCRVLR